MKLEYLPILIIILVFNLRVHLVLLVAQSAVKDFELRSY